MHAPRERVTRMLSRIQAFGEKALFFVPEAGARSAASPPGAAPRWHSTPAAATAAVAFVSGEDPTEGRWLALEQRIRSCRLCRLCETRTNAVPGSGTRRTRLFVIGEGPGEQEDLQGEAFVGAAGKLLTKILQAVGFERDQVFITNIVKCRPPRNRAPLPDEVAACAAYLEEQLELVRPAVILTLGASASQTVLATPVPISRLRGRVHRLGDVPVVPTYHPAALLRNPEYKRPTWGDVQLLRRIHDERVTGVGEAT